MCLSLSSCLSRSCLLTWRQWQTKAFCRTGAKKNNKELGHQLAKTHDVVVVKHFKSLVEIKIIFDKTVNYSEECRDQLISSMKASLYCIAFSPLKGIRLAPPLSPPMPGIHSTWVIYTLNWSTSLRSLSRSKYPAPSPRLPLLLFPHNAILLMCDLLPNLSCCTLQ